MHSTMTVGRLLPALVADRVDPARHPLRQPEIAVVDEEMRVPRQHLLADPDHLVRAEAGVDAQIFERAIEPADMLFQFERPAVKRAGHVERGVAVFEAAVANGITHVALGHDVAR